MTHHDFQLITLNALADGYRHAIPEIEAEIDSDKLTLQVKCSRSSELAARFGISDSHIPGWLEMMSVDLGRLTTKLNTVFERLVPHFPAEKGCRKRAQEVQFYAIATPIINAAAWPKGVIYVNHSLVSHVFVTVSASILLLFEAEAITEAHSAVGRRLRRAIGTHALKTGGRLAFGSGSDQSQALQQFVSEEVARQPRILSEIRSITNRLLEFVLAHEASHIVLGHTEGQLRDKHFKREMDADELATQVLVRLCGRAEAVQDQLWLKLPLIIALLEIGEEVRIGSVDEFARMIRRRPTWAHRLFYLMEFLPSDVPQAFRLNVYHTIRNAISAVWKEMEAGNQ